MRTEVHLLAHEGRFEFSLRFGRPAQQQVISPGHRVASFEPGEVFAFVQWQGNEKETEHYGIAIVRAARPGEPMTSVPFVHPGGEVLAHVQGLHRVQAVLAAIDTVDAIAIRPDLAAPDYWRHVGNRVAAGSFPRAYSLERHRAWLMRKRVRW